MWKKLKKFRDIPILKNLEIKDFNMKVSWRHLLCLLLGLGACKPASDKKNNSGALAGRSGATDTNVDRGNGEGGENELAFYTGIDGVNDYSLLLPSFQTYTLSDESIAKIEEIKVTFSEATINELLAMVTKKHPELDVERIKKRFSREQTTFKLTPLKPGRTTISATRRGGRNNTAWKKGKTIDLVITQYDAAIVESGKLRYTEDGSGASLKACKTCHETAEEGAPPHELGRIMEISDKEALEWISTGKLGGRKAKIPHAWEFSSEDQEAGIVAYLRTRQTHDVEQLAKLHFAEFLENSGPQGAGGPGGPGGPDGPGGPGGPDGPPPGDRESAGKP